MQLWCGSAGHKTLIFSTMTTVLDSIEDMLDYAGVGHTRLDGNTKPCDRGQILDTFSTTPSIEVLLLSVRSGGVRLPVTLVFMLRSMGNVQGKVHGARVQLLLSFPGWMVAPGRAWHTISSATMAP